MEIHPTRMCELLVGLPEVIVLGIVDAGASAPLRVHVEMRGGRRCCAGCGGPARVKERPEVELVDLPVFGRQARLVWRKHRLVCVRPACPVVSWTVEDPAIAARRLALTDRAGRWVTEQVGRWGRTVNEVAVELGCDWHTVKRRRHRLWHPPGRPSRPSRSAHRLGARRDAVLPPGAVAAPVLVHLYRRRRRRSAARCSGWSGRCRALSVAGRSRRRLAGADHVGHLGPVGPLQAGVRHDGARRHPDRRPVPPREARQLQARRVPATGAERDTWSSRPQARPALSIRRLLTRADERLQDEGRTKLLGLLAAGDPRGEVRTAWHAKEVVRSIYDHHDPDLAVAFVERLGRDLQDQSCPIEVRSLGRTLVRWKNQIAAWHRAHLSNAPTEAANNLIKRIKRVAFGLTRFRNHRIRVLLYAGRPDWSLLATIRPC